MLVTDRRPNRDRRGPCVNDPTFWILARASGLTAYALLTLSVLAGLVVKSKPFGKAVRQPTVTDLHRFLALLGLGAVAIHGITLVLDTTVKVTADGSRRTGLVAVPPALDGARRARGRADGADLRLLRPAASGSASRTGGACTTRPTSSSRCATVHGLAAGTDSARPWAIWLYVAAVGAVGARDGVACADRRARPAHPVARFPATTCPRHRNANWRYLEMTIYRITIDRSLCSGFGSCVELAPEAYELGAGRHRQRTRTRDRRPECGRGSRHLPDGRDHGRGRRRRGCGMNTPRRVLIVGAGLAGARCAETLRANGFDGELRLVGAEDVPPYERPALSKEHLAGSRDATVARAAAAVVLGRAWDRAAARPARRRGRSRAPHGLDGPRRRAPLGCARARHRRQPTDAPGLERLRRARSANARRRGRAARGAASGQARGDRRRGLRRHRGRVHRPLR